MVWVDNSVMVMGSPLGAVEVRVAVGMVAVDAGSWVVTVRSDCSADEAQDSRLGGYSH